MFASGFLVGFSEMLISKGIESKCIADTANLVVAGVHSYDYMTDFIESNQTDNEALAYGLVYIIDFSETAATWNCDNFGEDLNAWLNSLSGSFDAQEKTENTDETMVVESTSPIVLNHEDFGCEDCFGGDDPNAPPEEDENLDDINLIDGMLIFITVREILTDIEIILQLIETGIHSNEVWEAWKESKFYSAGYHLGAGGLGFGVLVDDIVTKYKEMAHDFDGATDLTEEQEQAAE